MLNFVRLMDPEWIKFPFVVEWYMYNWWAKLAGDVNAMICTDCTSIRTVAPGLIRIGPSTTLFAQMGYDSKEAISIGEMANISVCIYNLCLKKCLLMLHIPRKLALSWSTEIASKNLILNPRQEDS